MKHQLFTGTDVKRIDRIAIEQHGFDGYQLMIKAGKGVFNFIQNRFQQEDAQQKSMLVLCGTGNNGGDGYIVAACALEAGWQLALIACGPPTTEDARRAAAHFKNVGGDVATLASITNQHKFDVVVDAILGVGIKGAPRGSAAELIDLANGITGDKIAVDVPSGIDADTGAVHAPVFYADHTITFIRNKIGLKTGPALNHTGYVHLKTLGIGCVVSDQVPSAVTIIDPPPKPFRPIDSHKGSYGHAMVVGGGPGMLGAALLAGRAALRSGCGKVHIISTQEHLDLPALAVAELMSATAGESAENLLPLSGRASALAIGPGLGLDTWARDLHDACLCLKLPLVIDADALTLLAETDRSSPAGNWVLTPHPAEAARLLNCSTANVQNDRLGAAREIARQRNSVCVLKGAGTIVADSGGTAALCDLGNPGMATAGMGDVLTGLTVARLAMGQTPLDAASAAIWTHARVGDWCAQRTSQTFLLAGDIIDHLYVV